MSISWVGLWPQGSDWSPGLQKLHSLTVATLARVILLKILTKAFICSVSFLTYTSVLWMLNVKNFTGNLHVILIKKQFPSHYSLLFVYILRHSLMWPQVTSNSWSSHVLDLETHSTTPGFPCSQLLYFHSISQASEFHFGVRFQWTRTTVHKTVTLFSVNFKRTRSSQTPVSSAATKG